MYITTDLTEQSFQICNVHLIWDTLGFLLQIRLNPSSKQRHRVMYVTLNFVVGYFLWTKG